MSRLHHFLPSYLSMPECPTQTATSVTAAVLSLAHHPESKLARLLWISPDADTANHAVIFETLPHLGILRMSGLTGRHSVRFLDTGDLSRALIHAQGFVDRQNMEIERLAIEARYAPPVVADPAFDLTVLV